MGKQGKCPVCGKSFDLDDGLYIGDVVDCYNCYTELEIISVNPIKLVGSYVDANFAEEEEEEDCN